MKKKAVKKSAQDVQDNIFRKMPAGKKIKMASDLAMLCLNLNRLNGRNHQPRKTSRS